MKAYYDKILLLVALIAVAASVGYYFSLEGSVDSKDADTKKVLQTKHGGEKWVSVDVPPLKIEEKTWKEVAAQDADGLWLYQLFTSPKIWIDSDNNFIVVPPIPDDIMAKTFGFKYGGIKNDVYPIKYKGFYKGQDDKVFIQLTNTDLDILMNAELNSEYEIRDRKGKTIRTGIVAKDFKTDTVFNKDGTIKKVFTVTLHDANLKRDVVIRSGEPTYIEENKALLLTPESGKGMPWEIKKVGDKFEVGSISYVVKDMNYDQEYAVIEKSVPRPGGAAPQVTIMKLSKGGNTPVK